MATTLVDLVKIVSDSVGVGAFQLGDAVAGYRGVEALTDGSTYSYCVQQGTQYEYGYGVYDEGDGTLTRQPLASSLNDDDPVPFNARAQVAFVLLAEDVGGGGGGGAVINDNLISSNFVWSSFKTNATISSAVGTVSASVSALASSTANSLATKEPVIAPGNAGDFWRGDKTWQSTSGLPVSTATQTALNLKAPLASPPLTGSVGINVAGAAGYELRTAPGTAVGTISNAGAGSGAITGVGTIFNTQLRKGVLIRCMGENRRVRNITSDTALTCEPFTAAIAPGTAYELILTYSWYLDDAGRLLTSGSLVNPTGLIVAQLSVLVHRPIVTMDQGSSAFSVTDFNIGPEWNFTGTGTVNANVIYSAIEVSRTQVGAVGGAVVTGIFQPGGTNTADWTLHPIPGFRPTAILGALHSRSSATQNFPILSCVSAGVEMEAGTYDKIFGFRLIGMYAEPSVGGSITNAVAVAGYLLEAPTHTNVTGFVISPTAEFVPAGKWFLYNDYAGYKSFLNGSLETGGAFGCNGKPPQTAATLSAALPTDGSATNAAISTAINAIRAALIANGIGA